MNIIRNGLPLRGTVAKHTVNALHHLGDQLFVHWWTQERRGQGHGGRHHSQLPASLGPALVTRPGPPSLAAARTTSSGLQSISPRPTSLAAAIVTIICLKGPPSPPNSEALLCATASDVYNSSSARADSDLAAKNLKEGVIITLVE